MLFSCFFGGGFGFVFFVLCVWIIFYRGSTIFGKNVDVNVLVQHFLKVYGTSKLNIFSVVFLIHLIFF